MWRRTYLFLLVVRLWFALSPSYLHPDENFQGPEVIAGKAAATHSCSHSGPPRRVSQHRQGATQFPLPCYRQSTSSREAPDLEPC